MFARPPLRTRNSVPSDALIRTSTHVSRFGSGFSKPKPQTPAPLPVFPSPGRAEDKTLLSRHQILRCRCSGSSHCTSRSLYLANGGPAKLVPAPYPDRPVLAARSIITRQMEPLGQLP
ncbi:hypothetical protein TCAP_01771, partial [Tolypocladium capitatum]